MIETQYKAQEEPVSRPWPQNYYYAKTGEEKLQILNIQEEIPETKKEACSMEAFFHQRYEEKPNYYLDLFMQTWLYMRMSAENGITFFNKKKVPKNWEAYATTFGLYNYSSLSQEEQSLQRLEWKSFFLFYLESCKTDKTYSSKLLGFLPLSEDSLSEKVVQELNFVLEDFPKELEMDLLFQPLLQCAEEVYKKLFS